MTIPDGIFKGYDIRGIYPDEINKDNMYRIGQAHAAFIAEKAGKDNPTIITGHDMRVHSPELYPVLLKALKDFGAHVVDIGLAATPTFYFAVIHEKADGGIINTASHNPPQYTGLKTVLNHDGKITKIGKPTGLLDIKEIAQSDKEFDTKSGSIQKHDGVLEEEIEHAFSFVDPNNIQPFTIVADPANAMAITYLRPLFDKLPCTLIEMNFELDGTFPSHQPDPLVPKNTADIRKRVVDERADLGIATDGDGDRMFVIDENGITVSGAQSTAIVARELLKDNPGESILYDIRYTMTPERVIKDNGGKSIITKVGHAFITLELNNNDGIYGGESSEHNFFRATGGAESQILQLLYILQAMSSRDKKLSELVEDVRASYESGEFNFKTDKAQEIIAHIKTTYSDAEISDLDGVAIEYPTWRANIRTSNTEPLMRLNLEAHTKEEMKSKLKEVTELITSFGAKPHDD